jgi:uncharacterized Tic20 family protein
MQAKPPSEERLIAALAHFSVLAFGLGMVVPAVFWAEQRKKSPYVAFQSLQAYGYQSLGYTLWLLVYLALMIVLGLPLILLGPVLGDNPIFMFLWVTAFMLVVFGTFGLFLLLPVVGAIACLLGYDFRYPLLGSRLARYIGYHPADPAQETDQQREERFVAAMGHFAVIFVLFGLFAPLVLWLTQGKQSAFLGFQSLQTVIYQAVGSLIYGLIYLLGVGLLLPFYVLLIFSQSFEAINALTLVLFFLGLCLLGLAALFGPLYHILGQWAGLRLLQGHDYRYPLLGRLVADWLVKREKLSEQ